MVDGLSNTLVFVFSFLFVLSLLVFVHEMGHYSIARVFKVSVERFSIGFGKPVMRWRAKSGTEWTVSRIPLGGYVKFLGDAGAASNPDTERLKKIKADMDAKHGKNAWQSCFHFKPLWQRTLIVLAGPVANFALAALIYMWIALQFGIPQMIPKITNVTPEGPAALAGFVVGDEILSIGGREMRDVRTVQQYITLRAEEDLQVVVRRGSGEVELHVTPERRQRSDVVGGRMSAGMIGVGFSGLSERKTYNIGQAAAFGAAHVYDSVAATCVYIGRIFTGKEDGKALGGIVKIGAITGKVGMDAVNLEGSAGFRAKAVFLSLMELAAALSIGLGFANLLPIPVLDGGHLVYYGYEAVMRRPLSERAQEIGFRLGFAALITLFLVLTWNDIGYVADLFGQGE